MSVSTNWATSKPPSGLCTKPAFKRTLHSKEQLRDSGRERKKIHPLQGFQDDLFGYRSTVLGVADRLEPSL